MDKPESCLCYGQAGGPTTALGWGLMQLRFTGSSWSRIAATALGV